MNKKELELYIHIPFCVRKCSYCDFLSVPATEQTREAYMAALFAEIGGRAKDYSDRTVTSIFIVHKGT
jgi:oxygen-independent coproporphyrinogen III oxidase